MRKPVGSRFSEPFHRSEPHAKPDGFWRKTTAPNGGINYYGNPLDSANVSIMRAVDDTIDDGIIFF
jgi:hypothetical protein